MNFRPLLTAVSLALLPASFAAQPATKQVTLEECVQMAFQNNLELRIIRYLPELSQLSLEINQGAYDPTFSFGYDADKSQSPGTTATGQINTLPNTSWSQNYDMGLTGLLPSGGDYRLYGRNLSQRSLVFVGDDGFYRDPYLNSQAGISLSQPLLKNMWIDATRWSIALNRKALLQDEQSVRAQLIQTATDIQVAYYAVATARENIVVQQRAVELADRTLVENRKRIEVGAMAPLEGQQAESQLASSRADLISAQQTYGVAQNTLKRLLTSDYAELADTQLEPADKLIPQPYLFSRSESWSRGLSTRPDIVQSQIELEKQNITIRYRRNQLFPQLDLVANLGLTGQSDEIGNTLNQISNSEYKSYGVGGRFSFPLGNRRARGSFDSAKVERQRLVLRHKQIEQNVMVAIDNAILVAQSAFERIKANREARIYAEAALDAEQKKLENGKSTTFEVLRLQRDLTTARSDEVRAIADYFRAMALLFQDEGSTLERLGVKILIN